jgi:predicted O-methyltransferase YrrM
MTYQYTQNWFDGNKLVWDSIIPQLSPNKVLEVGSYEGNSACYMIERIGNYKDLEIHCLDTWEGSIEHQEGGHAQADMSAVEQRFQNNTKTAIESVSKTIYLVNHKGYSNVVLPQFLADGKQEYFDFIYIDGSHQAPDVLFDAVVAFNLLKVGGVMAFDDYLWSEPLPTGLDPIRCPKIAVDSFINIYCRKIRVLPISIGQIFIQKIAQ